MVKVAEYKGYPIYYESANALFSSDIQGLTLEAKSEDALKAKIDKAVKQSGVFPIDVIHVSGSWRTQPTYGRITSYDPESKRGWFISDKGERGKPWGFNGYYLDTEKNRGIAKEIKRKTSQQEELAEQINHLIDQLEKPFPKYFAEISK